MPHDARAITPTTAPVRAGAVPFSVQTDPADATDELSRRTSVPLPIMARRGLSAHEREKRAREAALRTIAGGDKPLYRVRADENGS